MNSLQRQRELVELEIELRKFELDSKNEETNKLPQKKWTSIFTG